MNDTGRSILEMLRDGQISLEEAERLMGAVMDRLISEAVADAASKTVPAATAMPLPTEVPTAPSGSDAGSNNADAEPLPPVSGSAFVPWPNDNTLRVAAFIGHRIVKAQDGLGNFTVELEGDAKDVVCYGNLECDNIQGNVTADGNLTCDNITSSTLNIGGNLEADDIASSTVMAGGDISCDDVGGNVNAGGNVECNDIGGSVMAGGNLSCGDIGGSASAGGNLEGGDVGGDASAGGNLNCGEVGGNTCDGSNGGGSKAGDAFRDFMNHPDWAAAKDTWEKQSEEFRRQWETQGKEMAENLRKTAQEMGNVASHIARDISRSVNETMKKFK